MLKEGIDYDDYSKKIPSIIKIYEKMKYQEEKLRLTDGEVSDKIIVTRQNPEDIKYSSGEENLPDTIQKALLQEYNYREITSAYLYDNKDIKFDELLNEHNLSVFFNEEDFNKLDENEKEFFNDKVIKEKFLDKIQYADNLFDLVTFAASQGVKLISDDLKDFMKENQRSFNSDENRFEFISVLFVKRIRFLSKMERNHTIFNEVLNKVINNSSGISPNARLLISSDLFKLKEILLLLIAFCKGI